MNEHTAEEQTHDWVIFRGSPSLCGDINAALPDAPQLLWSTSVQTRTVAAPIVYDGYVYTLDRKGRLRRFSSEGDSLLMHDFQTSIEASFVVDDSMLYVGRIDGHVNAFSLSEQRVVWDFETLGQISGSPNLVGDYVLVGSYDGSMYTLRQTTGSMVGQFETARQLYGTTIWYLADVMHGYVWSMS